MTFSTHFIYELYFAKDGIESKIKIQNIQVIQKKLYEKIQASHWI